MPALILEISAAGLGLIYLAMSFVSLPQKHHRFLLITALLGCLAGGMYLLWGPELVADHATVVGFFHLNNYGEGLKILILGLMVGLLLLMGGKNPQDTSFYAQPEFLFLISMMLVGSLCMISAHDFLSLYLGMELQSLAVYILLSCNDGGKKSTEAAMKFFVLSAIASALCVYGISLIYGITGTTNFIFVAMELSGASTVSLGLLTPLALVFVLAGLCFKVALVPFHLWAADVYEAASIWITGLLATVSKVVGVGVIMALLMGPFAPLSGLWGPLFLALGLISLIVGVFGALGQRHLLRLLGFSAVANMGFLVLGLGMGQRVGLEASYAYLLIYVMMLLGVMALIMEARHRLAQSGHSLVALHDLKGLATLLPGWSLMLAILLFSLSGLPPLAGFFAKLLVMMTLVNHGYVIIATIALVLTVLSAYYYLRPIKLMYVDALAPGVVASDLDLSTFLCLRAPSFICVMLTMAYGIAPDRILRYVVQAFS